MIFAYLVNFYLQIQNPINLISMSIIYLESFGVDLSEHKLFQCVSILLTVTSTSCPKKNLYQNRFGYNFLSS